MVAIERLVFTDPWPTSGFEAILEGWSRIVEAENRVVGYVFARFAADETEIMNLAVHPDHRRQGLGRRLVGTAIQAARTAGTSKVFLEVRLSNQPAQRFYGQMGFQPIGFRRAYYERPREDALILCCLLKADGRPA